MKRASDSVNVSRFLPCFDLAMLLFVLTCGTAGMSWVTAPPAAISAEDAAMPVSPEEKEKQLADLAKEIERLRREIEQKEDEANRLQAALHKAETNSPDLNDTRNEYARSSHDLEKLRLRLADLKNSLRDLQREASDLQEKKDRLEQLRKAIDDIENRIRDLAARLEQLTQQNRTLRNDIDEMNAAPIDHPSVIIDFYPVFTAEKNRQPAFVLLSENTVTPVRDPYYTFTKHGDVMQASLERRGETIDGALAPGSSFEQLLGQINSRKQYVFLLVDSSSFETFRKVRESLQERGIPFGWDPSNYTTMNFVSGREGAVEPGTIR